MVTQYVFFSSLSPSMHASLASLSSVVNCTEPGHIENSIRQVLPSGPHRYSFQTTVSYRCNPGYYLLGTSSISCQGDGTWDRSLPKCLCEYLRGWLWEALHDSQFFLCVFKLKKRTVTRQQHNPHYWPETFPLVHCSLSLISSLWLDSGAVWPPQHATVRPDLRRPSDSRLSHPVQLHRPAHHHRQHDANVPAGRPVERLTTTLLWYRKLHPDWLTDSLEQ